MKMLGIFFLISFSSVVSSATPSTIYLIRHAEKPLEGSELSEKGWARAKALPTIFSKVHFSEYGSPVCLIGMNKKKIDGSVRALQTLKYISQFFNLRIVDTFNKEHYQEMLQFVMTAPACEGQLAVIAWEHNGLEKIASELGIDPKPKWPGDTYDRVWVIEIKKGLSQMKDLPQQLLIGDSEK